MATSHVSISQFTRLTSRFVGILCKRFRSECLSMDRYDGKIVHWLLCTQAGKTAIEKCAQTRQNCFFRPSCYRKIHNADWIRWGWSSLKTLTALVTGSLIWREFGLGVFAFWWITMAAFVQRNKFLSMLPAQKCMLIPRKDRTLSSGWRYLLMTACRTHFRRTIYTSWPMTSRGIHPSKRVPHSMTRTKPTQIHYRIFPVESPVEANAVT